MYPDDLDELFIESRAEFEALSPQLKVAWCLHRLEADVNNGGFHQFFGNSSGAYVPETIAALDSIGAAHTSQLLQRAVKVCFPRGYPVDAETHGDCLADIDEIEDSVEPLDAAFLEYADPLTDLVNKFLERSK